MPFDQPLLFQTAQGSLHAPLAQLGTPVQPGAFAGDDAVGNLVDGDLVALFLETQGAPDQVEQHAQLDFRQEWSHPVKEYIRRLRIEGRIKSGEAFPLWRRAQV